MNSSPFNHILAIKYLVKQRITIHLRLKIFNLNFIKSTLLFLFLVCTSKSISAQILFERTSDSTINFIGEAGIVTGSYTFDQFAPDFYLEGFKFQLKKGIYYRLERKIDAFRISFISASGNINHNAKQYYEVKDTINLNGQWKNIGIQAGFEHFLYQKKSFCFYSGVDFVYRTHHFYGAGVSMFNELNFQYQIKSYAVGAELILGTRFTISKNILIAFESAFSVLNIFDRSSKIYDLPGKNAVIATGNHLSIEPSPFNRISIGYKF